MVQSHRRLNHWSQPWFCCLLLAALLCAASSGCVRRRMTIRSQPPGALVFIDDQEIGVTPVSTSFVYYGTRKIQLIKDGYETLTVLQKFRAPWYQIPPLDFASENLWPKEIRDERLLDFQLVPLRNVPNQELRERGEQLRNRARQGFVTPMPGFHGGTAPGSDLPPAGPETIRPGQTLPPGGWQLPEPPSPAGPPASTGPLNPAGPYNSPGPLPAPAPAVPGTLPPAGQTYPTYPRTGPAPPPPAPNYPGPNYPAPNYPGPTPQPVQPIPFGGVY